MVIYDSDLHGDGFKPDTYQTDGSAWLIKDKSYLNNNLSEYDRQWPWYAQEIEIG